MKERLLCFARCVAMGVMTAVAYGIVHDMITAHVCVEYFTIFHHRIISSESPTLLALAWGVVATWWVGLPLGVLLGLGATVGGWPPLQTRPMVVILVAFAVLLLAVSSAWGYIGTGVGTLENSARQIARGLPPERVSRFWYDAFSHRMSYGAGIVGGLLLPLVALAIRCRVARRLAATAAPPAPRSHSPAG